MLSMLLFGNFQLTDSLFSILKTVKWVPKTFSCNKLKIVFILIWRMINV